MSAVIKKSSLNNRQKLLVFTLFLFTFMVGTSEFVIMGLLTEISSGIGITVSKTGTLVSGFAIAFAIGTPVLTVFVSRFSKYRVMITLILFFILGNVLSALAGTYSILLISRILTAVVSGALTALCMSIASETLPMSKLPFVIAFIFAGFTIASVLGVPVGTFVGQLSSWRLTFMLTAFLGIIAFVMALFLLPRHLKGERSSLKDQLRLFTHLRVILVFLIPTFSFAGTYIIYTYITPIIESELSIPSLYVSIVLLAYGLFSIISNYLSGKIASRNGVSKLRYVLIIQAFILTSLYFTMDFTIAGLISLMLMALTMFAVNASIQLYLMNFAEEHSPALKDFASSLTPIAINIGIAVGSSLGGYIVNVSGLIHLSWVGGLGALIAAALTFAVRGLDKKEKELTNFIG